jgi:hypothetical protein
MKPACAHAPQAQSASPEMEGQAKGAARGWRTPQWWPTLAAIAFAAFVALDLFRGHEHGGDLAPVIAASGLVYLAAAALRQPSTAWLVFFLSVGVITAAKLGWTGLDATWLLLGFAVLFFAYGLLRDVRQLGGGLPLQALAMLAFGATAAIALYVNEVGGAFLVAAGLLAHAGWDAYHHWANKVVIRSMAEFCFVLDTLLAAAIVVATLWR